MNKILAEQVVDRWEKYDRHRETEDSKLFYPDGYDEPTEVVLARQVLRFHEKLPFMLRQCFEVGGDCYTFNLTRCRSAFAVGTIDVDDFEEFTEEDIEDIARYVLMNM